MLTNQHQSVPYLKSLSSCLNKMVSDGYAVDFKVTENGLEDLGSNKTYSPEDVTVTNFFRFEGVSDPDDMAILYVIETKDGAKGTLVDAYGTYADSGVNDFITQVDKISKKTEKKD